MEGKKEPIMKSFFSAAGRSESRKPHILPSQTTEKCDTPFFITLN